MSLCVDCLLREQPSWLKRYRSGSLALLIYGGGAFLMPDGPFALILQGLFFLTVFPWIVWPLIAASQPDDLNQEYFDGQY
jgi:hypothetical protein